MTNKLVVCTQFTLLSIGLILMSCNAFSRSDDLITVYTEMDLISQKEHPMLKNGLAIIKQSTIDYRVKSMPWNRAFKLAKANRNAVVFPIYKTPSRANSFHWLCPITPSRDMYLFRLSNRQDLHIDSLGDIKEKVVGVVKDSMLHQYITNHTKHNNFSLDSTVYDATNIHKLLKGRLDYIAQSQEQLIDYFTQHNLPHSLVTRELLIYDNKLFPMCLGINKKTSQSAVKQLRQAYQSLYAGRNFAPSAVKNGFERCHHSIQ